MSVMSLYRANNVGKERNEISRSAEAAISQLNVALDRAIKFSAMMSKDPRGEFTAADRDLIRQKFDVVLGALMAAVGKAQDLGAMRNELITADELLTKYSMESSFEQYVNELD